jgi:hypothetical protein
MSKIVEAYCAIAGHLWVTGRCFLADGEPIDLKWKACRRCQHWEPEGGVEQIEAELAAVRRERAAPAREKEP